MELIHTCYRITDPERSVAFYEALGFEKRRELPIREEAVNYVLGVPGQNGPELELTHNFETPEGGYEIGTGYGHVAVTVDDLDGALAALVHSSNALVVVRARSGTAATRVGKERRRGVDFVAE